MCVLGNQLEFCSQLRSLPWTDVPEERSQTLGATDLASPAPAKSSDGRRDRVSRRCPGASPIARTPADGISDKRTRDTVHAINSLTAEQAKPHGLARWIRGHWHVENKVRRARDAASGVDLSKCVPTAGPAEWPTAGTSRLACFDAPATPTSRKRFANTVTDARERSEIGNYQHRRDSALALGLDG